MYAARAENHIHRTRARRHERILHETVAGDGGQSSERKPQRKGDDYHFPHLRGIYKRNKKRHSADYPKYPSGDIIISSLHKTLPSLTQTAVINIYNEKLIERIKRFNDIFQTTSPSYVLMNSISICADYVLKNRRDFCVFYENLCDLRLADTNNLRIMYTDDISKIIVSTAGTDISGCDLAKILRDKYKIEVEAYYKSYVLLMTSVADGKDRLDYLKKALEEIDGGLICKYEELRKKPPCPDKVQAWYQTNLFTPIRPTFR